MTPMRSIASVVLAIGCVSCVATELRGSKPNVVIFFADDWGWGDLGANVESTVGLTPNLDALAAGGMRFTDFHVGASVCTPSRSALITGRIGLRTGVVTNFGPSSLAGMAKTEVTLQQHLKTAGYNTYMIGKWHLGTFPGYHPLDRGFDGYVGVPYSIDMGCGAEPTSTFAPQNKQHTIFCPRCPRNGEPQPACPADASCGRGDGCADFDLGVPLFKNHTIVAQPVDLDGLSAIYAQTAQDYITAGAASGNPFMLYYAASHVHVPQNHAAMWENKSTTPYATRANGGLHYAAALLEMDNSMGIIVDTLEKVGVKNNTLILVTGDNGNWECKCNLSGNSGPFRGLWQKNNGGGSVAKCTVWEGGHREPGIAHWPGRIVPQVSNFLASSMDFFPTLSTLVGLDLPSDRHYDGVDLSSILFAPPNSAGAEASLTASVSTFPPRILFHPACACGEGAITAGREGPLKAVWSTGGVPECGGVRTECLKHDMPLIFNLVTDPAEEHPLTVATTPNVTAIQQRFNFLRSVYLEDIANGFVSNTSYASGPAGQAVNCCNKTNAACACLASDG